MPTTAPRSKAFWLCSVAVLLLSACTAEDVVPTAPMALDGASLMVEPLPQEACDPAQPYVARVRWSVSDWDDPRFDFHLGSSQGKLWTSSNAADGELDTGPWVQPGMWFVMVDRGSRLVVAATPAPPLNCPAA